MVLGFSYPAPACGERDQRPAVLKDFHYLYFALVLCGLTAMVIVTVSLCTTPIPEEKASGVLMLSPPAPLHPHHRVSLLWVVVSPLPHRCPGAGSALAYSFPTAK